MDVSTIGEATLHHPSTQLFQLQPNFETFETPEFESIFEEFQVAYVDAPEQGIDRTISMMHGLRLEMENTLVAPDYYEGGLPEKMIFRITGLLLVPDKLEVKSDFRKILIWYHIAIAQNELGTNPFHLTSPIGEMNLEGKKELHRIWLIANYLFSMSYPNEKSILIG